MTTPNNAAKKTMSHHDRTTPSTRNTKKWALLLITGAALALIPRRSSRLADKQTKETTDADK